MKPKLEAKVRSVRRAARLLFPPYACLQVTIHFLSHSSLRALNYCEQKSDRKTTQRYFGAYEGLSNLVVYPGLCVSYAYNVKHAVFTLNTQHINHGCIRFFNKQQCNNEYELSEWKDYEHSEELNLTDLTSFPNPLRRTDALEAIG